MELQKIHDDLTKAKYEHTFTLRMTRPIERFHTKEPIHSITTLVLIRSSVYYKVFNIPENFNKFVYSVSGDKMKIRKVASPSIFV